MKEKEEIHMKKFTCSSMGYDCGWKQISATEELLADLVAVHLRECHGVRELTPEQLGNIKNSFSNPTAVAVESAENPDLRVYNCDLGPNCAWHYIAQTEELIADGVAVHAREAHGIREFTPEMKTRVENSLHVWRG